MYERLKNKTILLIEDEKIIRDIIASMLKFFFKEVYTAIDGIDGLDTYETYLPDIIITDLKMPNMCGFELIDELQKRSSTAFMVIVSAHTDTELLMNAIHHDVDRYIIKPVTEEQLFEIFSAYLEKIEKELPQIIQLSHEVNLDLDHAKVLVNHHEEHLNKKEVLLLKLLCKDKYKTFTYEEIEYQVWGNKSMSMSAIRSVVRDLRKKIGTQFIINISGTGYRLTK